MLNYHLLMYTNPPMRQTQRRPTTNTASGLIGARPFHQPVLSIQVYIVEWPFSCKIYYETDLIWIGMQHLTWWKQSNCLHPVTTLLTSNKWSKKKWESEPAAMSKKHCLLLNATCTNTGHQTNQTNGRWLQAPELSLWKQPLSIIVLLISACCFHFANVGREYNYYC